MRLVSVGACVGLRLSLQRLLRGGKKWFVWKGMGLVGWEPSQVLSKYVNGRTAVSQEKKREERQ